MLRYNTHMKHLYTLILTTTTAFTLSSCAHSAPVAPSQNDALNKISNSKGKEKKGYMQEGLDAWLENDWAPAVNADAKVQEKYMEKREEVKVSSITTQEELKAHSSEKLSTQSQKSEVKYVEKPNKPFTLQEYVDKTEAYMRARKVDLNNSHVEKLNSMPVIGK